MKPTVDCARVTFHKVTEATSEHIGEVAYLDILSDHPKLGPPRTESQIRTSLIVKKNLEHGWFETLNTIYRIVR